MQFKTRPGHKVKITENPGRQKGKVKDSLGISCLFALLKWWRDSRKTFERILQCLVCLLSQLKVSLPNWVKVWNLFLARDCYWCEENIYGLNTKKSKQRPPVSRGRRWPNSRSHLYFSPKFKWVEMWSEVLKDNVLALNTSRFFF